MLAIAGGKGGCGKTTTAVGLAVALDGPVLVADADVDMPNLHAVAGVDRDPAAVDVGPGEDPLDAARCHPSAPEVSVLPAPRVDGSADLHPVLSRLDAVDGPVLLDCPAGAGPDAAVPLRAADAALIVSTLCGPALRDTAKTAAMARAVGTPVAGAVLTRTTLRPSSVSDLLGCPVLAAVPEVAPPILTAAVVRAAYARLARRLESGENVL